MLWRCKCSLNHCKGSSWTLLTMSWSSIYKYLSLLYKGCTGTSPSTVRHTQLVRAQALRTRRKGAAFLSPISPSFLPRKNGRLRDLLSLDHVWRHCKEHSASNTATPPLAPLQWQTEWAGLSVCLSVSHLPMCVRVSEIKQLSYKMDFKRKWECDVSWQECKKVERKSRMRALCCRSLLAFGYWKH